MRDTLTPLLSNPARPTRGRRLRLLFGVVLAVLATVAFLVPPAAVGDSAAADEWPWDVEPGEDSDLFPLVGEIDFRGADGEKIEAPDQVGVDSELGVAVFIEGREVFLVDTSTLEQTVIPDPGDEHIVSPIAVIDAENHRLIMHGSTSGEVPGERAAETPPFEIPSDVPVLGGLDVEGQHLHGCAAFVNLACSALRNPVAAVTVMDLRGERAPVTRKLELPDETGLHLPRVPFDYHAPTDNMYLATDQMFVHSSIDGGLDSVAGDPTTTLHEISIERLLASEPSDGVAPTWSYVLESCPLVSTSGGGHLARGRQGDFIAVACEGGAGSSHGIARVDLNDGQDPSDTSNFRTTFDPFVGDISEGVVSGDTANDLIFIQVVLSGARMFVYDAYRRAWTGALELARLGGGANRVAPVSDPRTGRMYAFHSDAGTLRVTEARWPAVPNSVGRRPEHDLGMAADNNTIFPRNPPLFDEGTGRMFVNEFEMCLEQAADGTCAEAEGEGDNPPAPHFRVFEDRLPDRPVPAVHPDYDARTSDISEEPGVATSTASANAKAFGARHLWVGGTVNATYAGFNQIPAHVNSAPVGGGSRDAIRGQVLGANLSRISTPTVGALATGLHIADQQTSQDLQRNTNVRCVPSRTASRVEGEADCLSNDWQSDEPGEGERELRRRWDGSSWPDEYPAEMRGGSAYCDDFGGEPSDDAKPGSAVACDSEVPQVVAGALFSPSQEDAGNDTPGLHVGYAESSTDIHEDESLGMVATASAVARDVDLFGQVSIGEVRTEATAVAHGRPGTASTELVREYRQVRIGDFACGWQDGDPCDLYEVAHQINRRLGPKAVARVPSQDTFLNPDAGDEADAQTGAARVSNGTPGGAKALVTLDPYAYQSGLTINNDTHSELPGLQITVYHDTDRTARQVLQLAAVELDANYLISPAATWDAPDWGSGEGTGGDGGLSDSTGVGGAAARSIAPPPPFAHLSQDPPTTTSDDSSSTTGDAGDVVGFDGGDGTVSQGDAPSLGTADAPAVSTGDGVAAPEVASQSSGEQPVAVQGDQGGSSGPGGLVLTRQRMGQTVPLAVLWVLAALPFYLAVRRRRLTASATRT